MNGYYSSPRRALRKLLWMLPVALGLSGSLLLTNVAIAQEEIARESSARQEPEREEEPEQEEPKALTWARVDFIRNRVQLVPRDQSGRRANISDILTFGDALRTARASRAELRFNDGSLARVGERATFRFTPNTRNFQLSNGTILLLIPPGRGRSTIQTPNAVTGIQGSALFVRYIPETDTTIVGALTDNPDGPMVLFNRDGTEQQALRANEIGVIEGNQITELYQFDGTLFWQSSGLAEGFNYLSESAGTDELDGVRQEIREAISTQSRINGDSVITNPETFKSPSTGLEEDLEDIEIDIEEPEIEFEGSPAQDYESSVEPVDEQALEVGVNNSLEVEKQDDVALNESDEAVSEGAGAAADEETADEETTGEETTGEETTHSGTADSGRASEGTADSGRANEGSANEGSANEGDVNASNGADADSGAVTSAGSESSSEATQSSDSITSAELSEDLTSSDDGSSQTSVTSGADAPDASASGADVPDAGASDAGASDAGVPDINASGVDASGLGGVGDSSVPSATDSGASAPDVSSSDFAIGDMSDVTAGELSDAGVGATDIQSSVDTQALDSTLPVSTDTISTDASDVTVPNIEGSSASDVDASLLAPVPDQVDNLDEGQVVHDLELHNPGDSADSAGAPGVGASAGATP